MNKTKIDELIAIINKINILFSRHNALINIKVSFQPTKGYIIYENIDKYNISVFKQNATYKECKNYLDGLLNALQILSSNISK